jgi:hypothetical protein
MNKIKNFVYAIIVMTGVLLSAGCTKDDPSSFQAMAAVNFTGKTIDYTFMANPEDEYVLEIPVKIIGDTVSYDRYFKAAVVKDTSTTATAEQYKIIGGVVKKGAFTGTLSVRLYNAPALATATVSLKLQLADTTDFKAGNIESNQFIVRWTDKVIVPSWSYYRYFFTSVASTAAYRIIVQTTGLTTLTAAQYVALGAAGAQVLGTQFGDYVKQWNKDNPTNHLKHDDGTQMGQEIVPLYYTHSKYD